MNSVTAVRHGRQGCALLAPGIRQPEKTFGHADSRGRKAAVAEKWSVQRGGVAIAVVKRRSENGRSLGSKKSPARRGCISTGAPLMRRLPIC
jgi:hypothetical protein